MKNGLFIGYAERCWYQHGKFHRIDGPAIENDSGARAWYFNGFIHREDGPAIEYANGDKVWYHHGELHRLAGPAVEYFSLDYVAWYLNDKYINCSSQEEFERLLKLKAFW